MAEKMKYCVGGQWLESKTDKWMDVTDSSTGEVIAQVPCCTRDEVEEAIASAHAAFPEWSQTSISKRPEALILRLRIWIFSRLGVSIFSNTVLTLRISSVPASIFDHWSSPPNCMLQPYFWNKV